MERQAFDLMGILKAIYGPEYEGPGEKELLEIKCMSMIEGKINDLKTKINRLEKQISDEKITSLHNKLKKKKMKLSKYGDDFILYSKKNKHNRITRKINKIEFELKCKISKMIKRLNSDEAELSQYIDQYTEFFEKELSRSIMNRKYNLGFFDTESLK